MTDGSTELSGELADVLNKIRQENEHVERVLSEDPTIQAVSIAHLIPLPKPSTEDELAVLLRHELEGAHLAQLRANRTETLGGQPLIRLLVANSGENSAQRQEVAPALLAKVSGPERLVTVVVTGRSLSETIDSIDTLRAAGVPVVASRLAGDRLTNLKSEEEEVANLRGGLARIASPASDQAAATAAYLKPTASRVLIIRDTNPSDIWLESIDNEFRDAFEDNTHKVVSTESYDSRLGGVANGMSDILQNICAHRPEAVYFAGRTPALVSFIQALPGRNCQDLEIKIIAGADAVELLNKVSRGDPDLRNGLNANASVQYTGQAHPESWKASPESFLPEAIPPFSETCEQYCFTTVSRDGTLEDGGAIMGYDAIVTAVTAIREKSRPDYKTDVISQSFKRLHGVDAIHGASGEISLDQFGRPVNKAVPILQVNSNGTVTFLKLSSPLGSPCKPRTELC
ncbi:MAG: hypothetical protein ACRDTG_33070 [Pseudonocardiaceae bacterium]